MFGFAVLGGRCDMGELGYTSLDELFRWRPRRGVGSIELDFYWTPKKLSQAKRELCLIFLNRRKK